MGNAYAALSFTRVKLRHKDCRLPKRSQAQAQPRRKRSQAQAPPKRSQAQPPQAQAQPKRKRRQAQSTPSASTAQLKRWPLQALRPVLLLLLLLLTLPPHGLEQSWATTEVAQLGSSLGTFELSLSLS